VVEKILKHIYFLRHTEEYHYKARILVFTHSYILALGLISLSAHLILGIHKQEMPFWIFLCIFAFLILEASLRIQNLEKLMTFSSAILSIYSFIVVPIGIYISGSITTPSSLYVMVVVGMVALLGTGRINTIRLLFILVVCLSFIVIESFFPQLILTYASHHNNDMVDWIFSFLLFLIFVFAFISKVRVLIEENEYNLMVQKEMLQKLSMIDPLTELFNKRWLDETFDRLMSQLNRKNSNFIVITIDIDHFKKYNDTYGHIQGDKCLKDLAAILIHSVNRASDNVIRTGGEEFILLLENTDYDGGVKIVKNIRRNLANAAIEHKNSDVKPILTISMGLTVIGKEQSTLPIKDILHYSDAALYKAKESGRDQCCGYDGDKFWEIAGGTQQR